MPVFMMNVPCTFANRKSSDVYGQPVYSREFKTLCAIVRFELGRKKTSVRADGSGSRGHAEEEVAVAVLLMRKTIDIKRDDRITLRGERLVVTNVRYRYDVMGKLDHLEVSCDIE